MRMIPFISLGVALVFGALAWFRRDRFEEQPYHYWFIHLHMTALGLHQFEEYGWPGDFRPFFVSVFAGLENAETLIPSVTTLELLNALGFTTVLFLWGWLGTRVKWAGLALLFANFGNGFFHLTYAVTRMTYVPGMLTGAFLYLPLGLFATRYAIKQGDVDGGKLLLGFALGTFVSFSPFLHVWALSAIT